MKLIVGSSSYCERVKVGGEEPSRLAKLFGAVKTPVQYFNGRVVISDCILELDEEDSQLELGKTYTHIFEGEYIDLEYCFMPHTRFEFKPKQYQCAVNYVKHINKWREV
jgi:hypothetical protein